ncbi:hypothetical protein LPUS_08153 [Lasallia pustulata]|uniref:Rhodopsin domain-containing protein n=1 Tax=Lasallia pustulata TaxID=136370 RepID=A0A1W5D4L1_9LECA|nr:hypothetical protein LPUS_08153 [Lasallia pustulata]
MPAKAGSGLKISELAFKGAIGALFGLAVLCAAIRTCIRIRRFRRLFIDDAFLLVAALTLTANTALTYVLIPYIYTKTDVGAGVKAPSAQLMQHLVLAQRVFTWTTLYAVKLSFLFFFRSIICRLRNLMIFWWCDFAVVILAYGACVAAGFMACSTFGPGLKEECNSPLRRYRQGIAVKYSVTADVITDGMIILIPVLILYRVPISLRQKISLMVLFSLNIVMISFAITRVAAANTAHGEIDPAVFFWFEVEPSVAVIMVSMSAFRALYVEHTAARKPKPTGRIAESTARPNLGLQEGWAPRDSRGSMGSEDSVLPLDGPRVSGAIPTHQFKKSYEPSCDSLEV